MPARKALSTKFVVPPGMTTLPAVLVPKIGTVQGEPLPVETAAPAPAPKLFVGAVSIL